MTSRKNGTKKEYLQNVVKDLNKTPLTSRNWQKLDKNHERVKYHK